MSGDTAGFISALDIGTTTIRCYIIDNQGHSVGKSYTKVKLHYPEPKSVEIHPDELWESVLEVMKNAVKNANITLKEILSLGISTQRATFITWRKDTGKPLHNFITWKDLRATEMIEEVNRSWKMKEFTQWILTSFKTSSTFKVTIRLLWMLTHNNAVKTALKEDNLLFGTMETWLIYKLTTGKTYVTDISNASATGMYDPFQLNWSFVPQFLNIPHKILPRIVKNEYDFGETDKNIFGFSIKIGCVMADQSASMFGSCSFKENDLKLTLGTGGFLDLNTGNAIQASLNGMYPLVGWDVNGELIYLSEVPCHDCGSLVEWMLESGLLSSLEDLKDVSTLKDNGGVYFISAFSGLGPPINNETCGSGFIGITIKSTRAHMIRAVLESIIYKIVLAYKMLREERSVQIDTIIVDGGVSKNDFICQMLADLTHLKVKRLSDEIGVIGVAFVAGLSCGLWKTKEELNVLTKNQTIFTPSSNLEYILFLENNLKEWKRASDRLLSWHNS